MKRLLNIFFLLLISNTALTASTDLWKQLSNSFQLQDQSNQKEVKKQIQWLVSHPTYMDDFAKNSAPYIYYILEEIKRQGLPGELALLPMIESNYNPFAYSHAGAAGLWQLMPGTSSGLGLKQNWWIDGRRGIISSTFGALRYMSYLNRFFKGNWIFAIAAYDAGEGTVQRAIRKNISLNKPTTFWALPLPHETKAYLPRLLAMASLIKYPRYFGIQLPNKKYEPYFAKVLIKKQINLHEAAKIASIKHDELLKLNPGYNRWITLPHTKKSLKDFLLLPLSKVELFKENLSKLNKDAFIGWSRHQVQYGETLSLIAFKNHTTLNLIKKINNLKSDFLKLGTELIIPHAKNPSFKSLSEAKRELAINHSMQIGPYQTVIYVKKGDTLSALSQKYNVKESEIIYWNRLKRHKLFPMQKLSIWKNKKKNATNTYEVKYGDSLGMIAEKHHLSLKNLQLLNPKLKNLTIKVKDILIIR